MKSSTRLTKLPTRNSEEPIFESGGRDLVRKISNQPVLDSAPPCWETDALFPGRCDQWTGCQVDRSRANRCQKYYRLWMNYPGNGANSKSGFDRHSVEPQKKICCLVICRFPIQYCRFWTLEVKSNVRWIVCRRRARRLDIVSLDYQVYDLRESTS